MEYESTIKTLIKTYIRKFYDTPEIIIMDTLLTRLIMFDDELCEALRVLPKEFSKVIYRLREDKLIKQETKINTKENNYQELKQVYYVNYGEVKDVIKYKIFKMEQNVEEEMGRMEEIFMCPVCKKQFNILEAQSLMVDYLFKCNECGGILEESRMTMEQSPHNNLGMLRESINEIVKLLKKVDTFKIPSIDYFQALEIRKNKQSKNLEEVVKVEEKVKVEEIAEVDVRDEIYFEEIKKKEDNVESKEDKKYFININGIVKDIRELKESDFEEMNSDDYCKYYEMFLNLKGED